MTAKEIRELASDEITSEIVKAREKLFRMRFQAKGKDVESPGVMKNLKRDIARYETVLRQRELAKAKQE
jgi:large subunit ribosomal protein L29